jgi:hypothetical protein
MLSVIKLNVIILSVIRLNVIRLNVIVLSVVMLIECRGAKVLPGSNASVDRGSVIEKKVL